MKRNLVVILVVMFLLAQSVSCFAWGFDSITSAVSGPSGNVTALVDKNNLTLWKAAKATYYVGKAVCNMTEALVGKKSVEKLRASLDTLDKQIKDKSGKSINPTSVAAVNSDVAAVLPDVQAKIAADKKEGNKVSENNAKLVTTSLLYVGAAAIFDAWLSKDVNEIINQAKAIASNSSSSVADISATKGLLDRAVPLAAQLTNQVAFLGKYSSTLVDYCTYGRVSPPSKAQVEDEAANMGK